jgi:hypothetical protein
MYQKPTPLQNGPPVVGWEIILNASIRLAVSKVLESQRIARLFDSKALSVGVAVVKYRDHRGRHFPPLTMCGHSALCNATSLCEHCFDEAGDSTKKRKKTGGRKRTLFLSPADKLKHDNKTKLDSSRRKRAKVKAENVMFLKLQHECGKLDRLKQESEARCEKHLAEIARLKQENTEITERHRKHEERHRKHVTVLREARAHAMRWMEANYGKVSLLSLMYML